jgi:Tfp pilus assembly protein PilV
MDRLKGEEGERVNKLRKGIRRKLKGTAGESLAEVLISLLIAALALTMLASVISTSARLITRSKETMKSYYDGNDAVSKQQIATSTPMYTFTIMKNGSTTISYNLIDSNADTPNNSVYYFTNEASKKYPVVSYALKKIG